MIDWGKIGPANSPGPVSTAPVAPASPGSLSPLPSLPVAAPARQYGTGQMQPGEADMTQADVDKLDLGQKIGHGFDQLGDFLFGQKSVLHDTPIPGIVGGIGQVAGAAGNTLGNTVVKPLEAISDIAKSIPLGGLPGGADDSFKQIGDWAKTNDPVLYSQWQKVDAASQGDVLHGGNLRADFNTQALQYIDDQHHDTSLGTSPTLAIGRAGVGSVGEAFTNAVSGWLGLLGNASQKALGDIGAFNPERGGASFEQMLAYHQNPNAYTAAAKPTDSAEYAFQQMDAGKFTEQQARDYVNQAGGRLSRVEESAQRLDQGGEVSDVERNAVEAYRSGQWSLDHANTYIETHGQGVTRNPVGQIAGTVLTDPLTYATIGAGSIAKAGEVGARIAEAGADATSTYEKLATTVHAVQQSQLGPAFRIARGMIDPMGVYKPSSVATAVTDLRNGVALDAFQRAYGPQTVADLRGIAREAGITPEIDSAIASYSIDQANLMVNRTAQRDLLQRGFGEEMFNGTFHPDDLSGPLTQNAGRDAVTELTDHMASVAKNTLTPEEESTLAGRLAVTFGKDVSYWEKRMAGMSFDLRSALHAVTYKRAEVGFEEARATMNAGAYSGDLPLHNMVLMTSDTLDNQTAEAVIANIRDSLKAAPDVLPGRIAAATTEWNTLAHRYPAMESIGYAPGGEEQLKALVSELDKKLQSGGITRRVTEDEMSDPALSPIKDFLDRNTMPGGTKLFHGSPQSGLRVASANPEARQFDNATSQFGAFMTPSRSEAERYAGADGKVYEAGAAPTHPYAMTRKEFDHFQSPEKAADGATLDSSLWGQRAEELKQEAVALRKKLESEGYDGVSVPGNRGNAPEVASFSDVPLRAEGSNRLWKVGFRPDEEVAWGLKRDINTGLPMIDRDPTISHVVDAVPGRQPFSDTTRNFLGQIIGKSKAERLNQPIESSEAMLNTLRDGVTGRRMVMNVEKRFERSTFDAGIPKPISKAIMAKAKDIAGLDRTTIRGLNPTNVWNAISEDIPRDLVLKDGSHLNVHIVMDHLLRASEGDLRIMGLSSALTQRVRSRLHMLGDGSNMSGQITVSLYNKLRYAFNPTFIIQRVTDAPYFSILYGVTPVGKGVLTGAKAATAAITENLGRTGLARDFSMDMPEFATRSNFTSGIKSSMQEAGLKDSHLQRILDAPDTIIANNMTNMQYARWGDIVRGTLDNIASAAEKADPAFQADMLSAGEELQRSFGDWRRVYSESAGRVLDDNEVGLKYAQDQLTAWRRVVIHTDGTLDHSQLIAEGERALPNEIANIASIQPDVVARELGYSDAAGLRRDVTGHVEKINGKYELVKGEHDLPWLEEQMREQLHAHPDVTRRASAYFGETWDGFWTRLSRGVDEGGLDISPHYAKEAQTVIAVEARKRGMDPWEYLSGVMASNIGAKDLDTEMGQLVDFLKAGKAKQPLEAWTQRFRATLDPSAQRTLLDEFAQTAEGKATPKGVVNPARFEYVTPKSAPGKAARPPVAKVPSAFKAEAGYVYRAETPEAMASGLPAREGVTTGAPSPIYEGKDGVQKAIYRIKDDGSLLPGRAGGPDRLTSKPIPPEDIEILTADGTWHPLSANPYDTLFETDFPGAVKQRIISGVPHPNPEVEGYMQALSKYVQDNLGPALGSRTRSDLRRLVEAVPTTDAVNFNRSQALVVSLLKNKITDARQDIFRLAEMQTKRSVLERSLNHPLFGLYPASYMWGKVLPETVKFLAKNPYAATYAIADVERAIAIQREYDPDMESQMNKVDRSSAAFLLDYLTPGLPWSDHSARVSPLVRDLFAGAPANIWTDELATVSPERWVKQFGSTAKEAVDTLGAPPAVSPQVSNLQSLVSNAPAPAAGPTEPSQITGPTKGSGLAPILADDLSRLQSILLGGASPNK